jgi:uncharacterized LabA/DUF88 family protein
VERLGVIIDWDNMWKCAREAFVFQNRSQTNGQFCPYELALHLAEIGGARPGSAELVCVQVHSGLPLAARDQSQRGAMDLRSWTWQQRSNGLVETHLRPLYYPKKGRYTKCHSCDAHCERCTRPKQKGVDVAIGIAAYESIINGTCDTVIVASHDSDLVPSIEAIIRHSGSDSVETVSWKPTTGRYRHEMPPPDGPEKIRHHYLDESALRLIQDDTDYPAQWRAQP